MTSSIFQYPLITYDVIDDVIEVGALKTNMIWNCLIKDFIVSGPRSASKVMEMSKLSYKDGNLGIFFEGIGSQTKKL